MIQVGCEVYELKRLLYSARIDEAMMLKLLTSGSQLGLQATVTLLPGM